MTEQRPPYVTEPTDWAYDVLAWPEHELVYMYTTSKPDGWSHLYGCADCGETALLHRAGLEHPRRWGKPGRCSARGR